MMIRSRIVQSFVVLFAATACDRSPTEATLRASLPLAEQAAADGLSALRVGSVRYYGDTARIEIPTRVEQGVPVDVFVTTFGGGCVASDTTITTVQGMRTTIVPYQRVVTNPRAGCLDILLIDRRRVPVVFGTQGSATLRVVGREEPGGRLFVLERRIVVR